MPNIVRQMMRFWVVIFTAYALILSSLMPMQAASPDHFGLICITSTSSADQSQPTDQHPAIADHSCCILCQTATVSLPEIDAIAGRQLAGLLVTSPLPTENLLPPSAALQRLRARAPPVTL